MELVSRQDDEYQFEHSINGSFVNHGAVILVDRSGRVLRVALNSARLGTAVWEAELGLVECRAWESETDLEEVSFIARHYEAALTGRNEDRAFAARILNDCISATRNQYLCEIMQAVCGDGRTAFLDPTAFEAVQEQLPPEPPSSLMERILAHRTQMKDEYRAGLEKSKAEGAPSLWTRVRVALRVISQHTHFDRLGVPLLLLLSALLLWLAYENLDAIEAWFNQ